MNYKLCSKVGGGTTRHFNCPSSVCGVTAKNRCLKLENPIRNGFLFFYVLFNLVPKERVDGMNPGSHSEADMLKTK